MYQSFQEIMELEKSSGKAFWEIIRDNDCMEMEITEEEAFLRMRKMYEAMKDADASYDPSLQAGMGKRRQRPACGGICSAVPSLAS